MKKLKYTAFLLTVVMLLNISVFALDYANDNAAETINVAEAPAALTYPELLSEDRLEKKHTERLYEKEADLMNAAMYKNSDDTVTTYLFSQDIKYVDSSGNIRDKSTVLSLDSKGNYSTKDNNVVSTLPKKISEGFTISYGEHNVRVVPLTSGKLTDASNARLKDNTLLYEGVYGNGTTVKYTPLLSGMKEDVILDKPISDISFVYILYTDGLTLKNNDNVSLSLYENNKKFSLDISPIEIYDSNGNITYGEYIVTELIPGEKYRLEIIPDKEFLASPNTMYPVTIDPSYTINSHSGTTKYIMDASMYSGLPSVSDGIAAFYNVGNMNDADCGYARTIMRFPELMNFINAENLTLGSISSVNYNVYCLNVSSSTIVTTCQYNGNANWNESTVSPANNGGMGYGSAYTAKSITATGWYSFNILDAVDMWLQDTAGSLAAKGLVFRSNSESNTTKLVRFSSSDSAHYFPYITITYTSGPSIPSNAIAVRVTTLLGAAIPNAVVYAYPQRYQSGMYPASPAITDSTGLAIVTGLNPSTTYGVNVIAQNYAAKPFDHYISPGQQINVISLSSRTLFLNPPLSGFTALSKWPHNNTSNCTSMCSTFTRICPHQYMNVYKPQNFGWRYDVESRLSFHQAIDISATNGTPVLNVFKENDGAEVIFKSWRAGCGNVVQLHVGAYYATYMHLSSYASGLAVGNILSENQVIAYVGNTGTDGDHLHFSFAKTAQMWVYSTATSNDNILNWDSEQINDFLDPFAYFN